MYKRIFLLIILFFGFFVVEINAECSLNTIDSTCKYFSSPFNSFNLNFIKSQNLDNYEAKLYFKSNPSNLLEISKEGNLIKNINPFLEVGVYVLKITSYNRAGKSFENNFEFLFDNTKPLPPIINLNLESSTNNILINGYGKPNFKIIAKGLNGEYFQTKINSNGNFSLNINLIPGINYFKFSQINLNGIESQVVERIILFNDNNIISSNSNKIEIDNLEINNFRTYKNGLNYITSKRNFYISGRLPENLRNQNVYVNGVVAKVDSSNKFGAFILLNEGNNKLKIQSGSSFSFVNVNYINPRFKFLNFNISKVVSENSLNLIGNSNYDLPFSIYLNGKFIKNIISQNGIFNDVVNGLKIGKNYLYLQGLNGEKYEKIIYYDNTKPKINLLTKNKIALKNELVFEINDDTGIDISNIKLNIGKYIFTIEDFNITGDFYVVDISKVDDGNYNFDLTANDRAKNIKTLNGVLNINKNNTLFERVFVKNGYFIGNKIFTKKGDTKIILSPSRYIAFKNIYLDGKEITNYEIKQNGDVVINLNFELPKGELELNYINSNYEIFSSVLNYYTDDEKPIIKLDYISNSYGKKNDLVKVSGEIIDSHFDWSSFNLNGVSNILRYGNYFESFVPIGLGNLKISGRDYSLNEFETTNIGGIFTSDISNTNLGFDIYSKNSFNGFLSNNNLNIKNYVYNYDGFYFPKIYLSNIFSLPVQQREGIRSINLNGFESSSKKFNSLEIITVEDLPPEIYFIDNSNNVQIIIDGTLSFIDLDTIDIKVNGVKISSISYCSNYNSVSFQDICIEIPKSNDIVVSVSDLSENSIIKSFSGVYDTISYGQEILEFFFNGNDLVTSNSNSFIQGQIISSYPINSVKIENKDCSFDDENFVCLVNNLNVGNNSFDVTITNDNLEILTKSFSINRIDSNLEVSINSANGYGVFKSGSNYFINLNLLNVLGTVNKNSILKVLVDGNEINYGNKNNNNFNLNVDLDENLFGKNIEELDLKIRAEDELGNVGISNQIKLIYNRVLQTIIRVIVG